MRLFLTTEVHTALALKQFQRIPTMGTDEDPATFLKHLEFTGFIFFKKKL